MSIQTIPLTSTVSDIGDKRAALLAKLLNGQTYMNFQVITAPYRGNLVVSVQGDANSVEELQGMLNMVLADELMKRLGA